MTTPNPAVLSLMNMTTEQLEREVDLALDVLYTADPHALVMTIIQLVSKEIIEMTGAETASQAQQAAVFRVAAALVLQEKARRESEA